jgi:hypothetical protein
VVFCFYFVVLLFCSFHSHTKSHFTHVSSLTCTHTHTLSLSLSSLQDGVLDRREVEQIIKCWASSEVGEVLVNFDEMDHNGDGKIQIDEFCCAMDSVREFDQPIASLSLLVSTEESDDEDANAESKSNPPPTDDPDAPIDSDSDGGLADWQTLAQRKMRELLAENRKLTARLNSQEEMIAALRKDLDSLRDVVSAKPASAQ